MSSWKVWEREVATTLGGTRTGPLGKALPDSIDLPVIAPECKYMQKIQLRKKYLEQAERNALKIEKIPVLAIKEANTGYRVVVMKWNDFVTLFNEYIRRSF